jgi:hypothetical protein
VSVQHLVQRRFQRQKEFSFVGFFRLLLLVVVVVEPFGTQKLLTAT